jgi:hypothetical protein
MAQEHGELRSSFIYADGFRSWGSDKPLNGIFDFSNHTSIVLGPRIDFGYKWIKVSIRADYQGVMSEYKSPIDEESVVPGHHDIMQYNQGVGGIFDDGYSRYYLGEDWNTGNDQAAYYIGEKQGVYGGYRGWRFTFVIRIAPLYKED